MKFLQVALKKALSLGNPRGGHPPKEQVGASPAFSGTEGPLDERVPKRIVLSGHRCWYPSAAPLRPAHPDLSYTQLGLFLIQRRALEQDRIGRHGERNDSGG